jgi:hypothetical protein
MYVNAAFAAPALIGALLLLAKPVITKKPKFDIPGIVVVSAAPFAVVHGFTHVESSLPFQGFASVAWVCRWWA